MAGELDLVAKLFAFERGHALPIASHRRVAIRSEALVLCPIAMAGEDTATHIIACGPIRRPAEVFCVPDPRIGAEHYQLMESLAERIERLFEGALRNGSYPQIWVPSGAVATHVDLLAERLRYNRERATVRRLGELLSFFGERFPHAGQQALIVAPNALCTHWTTGQQPNEDQHLGAVLAWIDPPRGQDVWTAAAQSARVPMGLKTDPEFDRRTLAPLVAAFNEARRGEAGAGKVRSAAIAIRRALEPIVLEIHAATQRAITLLSRSGLAELGDLPALEEREAAEFASFMRSRDAGHHLHPPDTRVL